MRLPSSHLSLALRWSPPLPPPPRMVVGGWSRAIRIYAVDRVPGVKSTVAGAQHKQKMSPDEVAGAERLASAARKQLLERKRSMEEAAALATARARASSPSASTTSNGMSLTNLRASLDSTIDGQHLAKDLAARAMRRRSFKLDDNERPLRMLFAGPSGVGKTAMAVAVCEALNGSCVPDKNFKRFNLSEFSHPSKFNRLTGGDPNYVGYKEGGELTNFIRQAEDRRAKRLSGVDHTSCVLLLDEVDRAADGLLTFLMNFLDQGQLTDGRGETVDASRAVIIMTTNCGQEAIKAATRPEGMSKEKCVSGDETFRRNIVSKIRTEVLKDICDGRWENLGRLGAIVPFVPLDVLGRAEVITRQLKSISNRLVQARSPAVLERWSEGVVHALGAQWDHDLGGRSTRDFIEENVVEAIAEALDGFSAESGTHAALELDVLQTTQSLDQPQFVCRLIDRELDPSRTE